MHENIFSTVEESLLQPTKTSINIDYMGKVEIIYKENVYDLEEVMDSFIEMKNKLSILWNEKKDV